MLGREYGEIRGVRGTRYQADIIVSTAPVQPPCSVHRNTHGDARGSGRAGGPNVNRALPQFTAIPVGRGSISVPAKPPRRAGFLRSCVRVKFTIQCPVNIFIYSFTSPICGISQSMLWYFKASLGWERPTALPHQWGPPFLAAERVKFLK